jgi:uncharacterized protein involved in exopolysaccharide biosynthesis
MERAHTSETRSRQSPSFPEISILEFLAVLLAHRYRVIGWSVAGAFLVALITLVSPREYTTEASFVPERADGITDGALARMAGQFGVAIPRGDATRSPEFYADLLRSREILARLVPDTFTVIRAGWRGQALPTTGTLSDLLEIREEDPARRRDRTIEWLREEGISASTVRETGVVRLSVTTRWPDVSHRIARRLLELVNEFNLLTRQSQAAAERGFIEERLEDAQLRLSMAEEELKLFLETNRQIQGSPHLMFERERLEREVLRRQQLFNSLSEAYETARISEVRNTPVVTVVNSPEVPSRPDRLRLALKGVLGLMLGGVAGVFHAFGREFISRRRETGEDDYRQLQRVWEDTVMDLRSVLPGGRGPGSGPADEPGVAR